MAPHGAEGEREHGAGELGHVMQMMFPVGGHPGKRWWRLRRLLSARVTVSSSGQVQDGHSGPLARPDLTRILQNRKGGGGERKVALGHSDRSGES